MNLFPPLFLILVFLMPGVAFYYTYNSGTWNSPKEINTYGENFAYGFLIAPIIHLFLILLLGINIDKAILTLANPTYTEDFYLKLGYYLVAINIFSYGLGITLHKVVRYYKLDLTFNPLKFDNEWYYFFSGENFAFKNAQEETVEVKNYFSYKYKLNTAIRQNIKLLNTENIISQITLVTEINKCGYLYRGFFKDFVFDKAGNLDQIHLSEVYRRKIDDDREADQHHKKDPDERYYPIAGSTFIIKYEHVKNVNIQFYQVTTP